MQMVTKLVKNDACQKTGDPSLEMKPIYPQLCRQAGEYLEGVRPDTNNRPKRGSVAV
jgi:hypothetical protein